MATKKSNKNTHKVDYTTLFSGAVCDMFSSKSDRSLIDYNSLKLVNWGDLAFVNKRQLSFFIEYIGAFFITINLSVLSMLFLVDFGRYDSNSFIQDQIAAKPIVEDVGSSVLGVSSVDRELGVEASADDGCSFLINEVRYSSNALVDSREIENLCVSYSGKNSTALWQADMKDGENLVFRGSCISVEDFSRISSITSYIIDSSSLVSGSCVLTFSR